jgi:regulation of enolase protein 1 (concanavalin A-like superfamily)
MHLSGLMVELSPSCWLKTSCEFGEPASQLGVVVTNAGFSDWSTLELPNTFRTVRRGPVFLRRHGQSLPCPIASLAFSHWPSNTPAHCHAPHAQSQIALRVRRQGSDYTVEACVPRDSLPQQGPDALAACPIKVGSGAPDRCAQQHGVCQNQAGRCPQAAHPSVCDCVPAAAL